MVLFPVWTITIEYLLIPFFCPGSSLFEKLLMWKDTSNSLIHVLKALCGNGGRIKDSERQKDYLGLLGLQLSGLEGW